MTNPAFIAILQAHRIEASVALGTANNGRLGYWQNKLAIAPDPTTIREQGNGAQRPDWRRTGTFIEKLTPGRTCERNDIAFTPRNRYSRRCAPNGRQVKGCLHIQDASTLTAIPWHRLKAGIERCALYAA
jgi:hypothetical protein